MGVRAKSRLTTEITTDKMDILSPVIRFISIRQHFQQFIQGMSDGQIITDELRTVIDHAEE